MCGRHHLYGHAPACTALRALTDELPLSSVAFHTYILHSSQTYVASIDQYCIHNVQDYGVNVDMFLMSVNITCRLLEQRPVGSGGILMSSGDMFLTLSEKDAEHTKNTHKHQRLI